MIQSVDSSTQITLTAPYSNVIYGTKTRVAITPDPDFGSTIRATPMYLTFTDGSAIATLHVDSAQDFIQSGTIAGDSIMEWSGVQWKGLRPHEQLMVSSAQNVYWKNNGASSGWPLNGTAANEGGHAGQPVTKNWCRTESQMNMGAVDGLGTLKERAIYPFAQDGFADFTLDEVVLHQSTYRWQFLQFQEYLQYATATKLWRSDTAIQIGTFARVEIADSDTPATTTNSNYLPPDIAQWTANSIALNLWKGLLSQYAGNYLHFYDSDGVFRKAVAL